MLDEFSNEELCPYLEPYHDYRLIKMNSFIILELAMLKRGKSLEKLTKFEKAIIFNDIRGHLFKMMITLSFLKARVVKNFSWLESKNVLFDLDTFQVRFNNYVVIDPTKSIRIMEEDETLDFKDIGGEEEKIKLKGNFLFSEELGKQFYLNEQ
jgi:hypothetical protein